VKRKAVDDSQDARTEVLLPAYRVTGNPEAMPAGLVPRNAQVSCDTPLSELPDAGRLIATNPANFLEARFATSKTSRQLFANDIVLYRNLSNITHHVPRVIGFVYKRLGDTRRGLDYLVRAPAFD
jgi:hypothetical protein